jgi:hypothetical protein
MASKAWGWPRATAARAMESARQHLLVPRSAVPAPASGAALTPHLPGAPDQASGDHKPAPNEGRPAKNEAGRKRWYASERIQLPENWPTGSPGGEFTADRDVLVGRPGFHIFGACPSCLHPTTSVCATEYLTEEAAPGAARPGAAEGQAASPAKTFLAIPAPGSPENETAKVKNPAQPRLHGDRQSRKRSPRTRKPWFGTARPTDDQTQVTVLQCACTHNHVPPKDDTFGCGSQWLLRVDYNDVTNRGHTDISVVPEWEAFHYWPAADAAAREIPASLTTARSAAKNWAGALTAILGLLGIGALLGSRSTIQNFSPRDEIIFGVLAFIAVLADGAMLYQSDLATFGWPRIRAALKPSDQWNADLDPLTQASASVRKLRRSVWAAAISAAAALGAVGILLFVPAAPGVSTSKVVYVVNSTKMVTPCGTVTMPSASATGPAASFLTFTPDVTNGKPVSISLSAITNIDAC